MVSYRKFPTIIFSNISPAYSCFSFCDSNCCQLYVVCVRVARLCPTLCDPMDCSSRGSSVHGILQARILEWLAMLGHLKSLQAFVCSVLLGVGPVFPLCLVWVISMVLSQSSQFFPLSVLSLLVKLLKILHPYPLFLFPWAPSVSISALKVYTLFFVIFSSRAFISIRSDNPSI
ncbi:unnamed protein product [Rangifer tarandus platyrhynchus]|uniref:Uncharacterized protein n=2 Tax=Rangifer tarandus platyrhynchus TaxID=3082113 RepID=A0ABN8ZTA9_RANTA|nr:unnamed protein product [Rangifer tarandus platyrhynchus]